MSAASSAARLESREQLARHWSQRDQLDGSQDALTTHLGYFTTCLAVRSLSGSFSMHRGYRFFTLARLPLPCVSTGLFDFLCY